MKRRLPVPLVPGRRGGGVLDAEVPPLSREELEAILELGGGQEGTCGDSEEGQSPSFCPDEECPCTEDECDPPPSGAYG